MVSRNAVSLATLVSFVLMNHAWGQDSLPIETLQKLKDAAVYVKTEIGPLKFTGTGFVVDVKDDTALIATNHHVVSIPRAFRQGGVIPGLRDEDRSTLASLQETLASASPEVSVVFSSGHPHEQQLKAEIVGGLEDPDLAILKVTGVSKTQSKIDFRHPTKSYETMALYILGFPFGDVLAAKKTNPTITISKGSISNIHLNANGRLTKLQIDGAVNPGNSGGPVVDAKGNLVGIAVQTIQGSNIGLAIPPGELLALFDGAAGTPTIQASKTADGSESTFELSVPIVDPLKNLKSVSAIFVEGAVENDASRTGLPQLASQPNSQQVELTIDGRIAMATLPLSAANDESGREVTIQTQIVRVDSTRVYLDPVVVKIVGSTATSTTTSEDRDSPTRTSSGPGRGPRTRIIPRRLQGRMR